MIETRLTKRFELQHPVILAPMAGVGGGVLAAAMSNAGGLGLIGGGYCDADWIMAQFDLALFDLAQGGGVGCGFITWRLAQRPQLLGQVLARAPRAVFLSFGDPAPFAMQVRDAGVALICQVQSLRDAQHAANIGADVIVVQGAAAGGHGESRATMTLVPEVADWLAQNASDVLLVAAGGIADGRGIAASLMLGADGVVMGTRFWASNEALVPSNHHRAGFDATGDETVRTKVVDIVRGFEWPERFDIRVLRNRFTDKWHGNYTGLKVDSAARAAWGHANETGDMHIASATVGEGIGMISASGPAGDLLREVLEQAEALLGGGWKQVDRV